MNRLRRRSDEVLAAGAGIDKARGTRRAVENFGMRAYDDHNAGLYRPGWGLPKLAAPARPARAAAGLQGLAHMVNQREPYLMALHGMGPNAMATLRAVMKAKVLGLRA